MVFRFFRIFQMAVLYLHVRFMGEEESQFPSWNNENIGDITLRCINRKLIVTSFLLLREESSFVRSPSSRTCERRPPRPAPLWTVLVSADHGPPHWSSSPRPPRHRPPKHRFPTLVPPQRLTLRVIHFHPLAAVSQTNPSSRKPTGRSLSDPWKGTNAGRKAIASSASGGDYHNAALKSRSTPSSIREDVTGRAWNWALARWSTILRAVISPVMATSAVVIRVARRRVSTVHIKRTTQEWFVLSKFYGIL